MRYAARCKYRTQKNAKNRHLGTIGQLCRAISSQLRHVSTIGKNFLNSNISCTRPHNMVNFGPLAAEIVSLVWGTPGNFNGFRVLATLLHAATSLNGSQPNFALCLAVSWPGTLYIHFRDLLPPEGILPRAKFTLCPSMHHRTSFSGYIFASKASIDNRKKLIKQQYLPYMAGRTI